jgi:hypothetical protein
MLVGVRAGELVDGVALATFEAEGGAGPVGDLEFRLTRPSTAHV